MGKSKNVICVGLALVLLLVLLPSHVFALDEQIEKKNIPNLGINMDELQTAAENFIGSIETELKREETNVVNELEKLIAKYNQLLLSADEETTEKLHALISTTNELISDYMSYENYGTRGSYHVVYSAEVAAAIAAFNTLGYDLAAELLTHARDNNILDSYYSPVLGSDVAVSSVFATIKNGDATSGSNSFPNSGSTDEKDLYYAIHAFTYRKSESGRVVIIEDRYDYAQGSMGGSFTGMVVNEMYNAQEAGVIVPYYTYIVENTSNTIQNQAETVTVDTLAERRMFSEQVILGKSEYKEFSISFDTSGYKMFQTFGELDTKIEIFNEQGTLLTGGIGDDSGYGLNSLIQYYCTAGTIYKVKVYIFSISKAGEFIFMVTPASGVVNSGSSSIAAYEDIWTVSGYTGYTFDTWTLLNQTKMITFAASSDGGYTFDITSNYDTYIYVIDPRSFRIWENDLEYNDDDGDGLNPKIVRELEAGIPYLVIYSAYNIQNASHIGDVTITISKN